MQRNCLSLFLILCTLTCHADYYSGLDALKEKKYAAAADEFRSLSELGLGKASFQYARMLEKGQIAEPDQEQAYAWYSLASKQGYAKADKAIKKLKKQLTKVQQAQGADLARQLTEQYGAYALENFLNPTMTGLPAYIRSEGTEGLKWPREVNFSKRATIVQLEYDVDEQGSAIDFQLLRHAPEPYVREAMRFLRTQQHGSPGGFLLDGSIAFFKKGLAENYGPARLLKKLRKRADKGSPYRKYYYANALEFANVLGHEYENELAGEWYLRAAQEGYTKAQYIVGRRLMLGRGYGQDLVNGQKWLEIAAQNNHPSANYFLARIHKREGDQERYLDFLTTSANNGHTTAMLHLAVRAHGEGNQPQALQWLEAAADHLDQVRYQRTKKMILAQR